MVSGFPSSLNDSNTAREVAWHRFSLKAFNTLFRDGSGSKSFALKALSSFFVFFGFFTPILCRFCHKDEPRESSSNLRIFDVKVKNEWGKLLGIFLLNSSWHSLEENPYSSSMFTTAIPS